MLLDLLVHVLGLLACEPGLQTYEPMSLWVGNFPLKKKKDEGPMTVGVYIEFSKCEVIFMKFEALAIFCENVLCNNQMWSILIEVT